MRRARRAVVAGLLAVVLGSTFAACGGDDAEDDFADQALAGKEIKPVEGELLPSEFLGLQVAREDVSGALASSRRSYVEATTLYSLRSEDLLQATLQVSRFTAKSEHTTPKFRNSLLGKIGASQPRQVRVGDDIVHLTTGTKQQLAIWFRGRYMLILATREDYPTPRTLIREALQVDPT
jgi:hypothetical protein